MCENKIRRDQRTSHEWILRNQQNQSQALADPIPQNPRKQAQKDPRNTKISDEQELLFRKLRSFSGHERTMQVKQAKDQWLVAAR